MGPPAGQQRGHGASKAGQAQNDKRLDECDYDVDVTPRSRAQTHVAMRMVGEGTIYLRYKQLLRSVIHAFRIQQDGFAPTTLVIEAAAGPIIVSSQPIAIFRISRPNLYRTLPPSGFEEAIR